MRFFSLILFLCSVVGCASFSKKAAMGKGILLTQENLSMLEGEYAAYPNSGLIKYEGKMDTVNKNSLKNNSLLGLVYKINNNYAANLKDSMEYKVEIKLMHNNRIGFYLKGNDKLLDSSMTKYVLKKDGFVYLKNANFSVKGIPGIYGNFEQNREKIGVDTNGDLISRNSYFIYGAALIIIGDTRKINSGFIYKRIK